MTFAANTEEQNIDTATLFTAKRWARAFGKLFDLTNDRDAVDPGKGALVRNWAFEIEKDKENQ